MSELLRERLGPTSEYAQSLIEIQAAYINTNHPAFISGSAQYGNVHSNPKPQVPPRVSILHRLFTYPQPKFCLVSHHLWNLSAGISSELMRMRPGRQKKGSSPHVPTPPVPFPPPSTTATVPHAPASLLAPLPPPISVHPPDIGLRTKIPVQTQNFTRNHTRYPPSAYIQTQVLGTDRQRVVQGPRRPVLGRRFLTISLGRMDLARLQVRLRRASVPMGMR